MADKELVDLPGDFERLLRQELSIEPSPEFAVRVRQRVGEQHRTPWWRARWIPAIGTFATLASIVIALIVPAIARWTSIPTPPAAPAIPTAAVALPRPTPPESATAVTTVQSTTTRRATPRNRATPAPATDLPVVIVDGRQREALSTLFRMMDQGRVSGDSFAATVPVSLEPIVDHMGDITVSPVVVSAMPPRGVLHNDER